MASDLSPQNEQFLDSIVASGFFPSRGAALDAAIAALREKTQAIPSVPEEHMAHVERGIESANAGRTQPMTPEYWERHRQRLRDAANNR